MFDRPAGGKQLWLMGQTMLSRRPKAKAAHPSRGGSGVGGKNARPPPIWRKRKN